MIVGLDCLDKQLLIYNDGTNLSCLFLSLLTILIVNLNNINSQQRLLAGSLYIYIPCSLREFQLINLWPGSEICLLFFQVLDNLPHDLIYSENQVSPWKEVWVANQDG